MMRRAPVLVVLSAVFASASPIRAQQVQLRSLPAIARQYEERLDAVRSGNPPAVFNGSARIVPARADASIASIGIAGVPQQQGHFCAGAVVDPHWLLTAAHCVMAGAKTDGSAQPAPIDPGKLQVLFGTNQLYRGGQQRPIERIVVHPEFRLSAEGVPINDLALLQFADAIPDRPLSIASDALEKIAIEPGDRVLIVGWGTANFATDSSISNNLLLATVPIVDRAQCNQAYRGAVTDRMFCAGLGTADSCQGDSGGPALVYNEQGVPTLIGVVSWGAGCTQKRYPGVYVNVVKYRGWIDATIGRQQTAQ